MRLSPPSLFRVCMFAVQRASDVEETVTDQVVTPQHLSLQHTATHCNTLQHTVTHRNILQHSATHYNTFQHTATHCNTLQHTATHRKILYHIPPHSTALNRPAPHCNVTEEVATREQLLLQHTATYSATIADEILPGLLYYTTGEVIADT